MTSTSKTELRSPDDQRTAAGVSSSAAVTRWIWRGLVAAMVAALTVEWLHIDDLRLRVVQLEQRCHQSPTDKHLLALFSGDQPTLATGQRSAATVSPTMRV